MNAGLDATRTYERVEHHLHAEVQAMTDLYKIGRIRRLHLGDAWGIVLDPDGVRSLTLAGLFRRWVGLLHEVVGIENARRIALGLRLERLAAGHDPRQLSPLAASLLLEAHHEFARSVIANLRRSFLWLWTGTVGLCDPATRISDFDDTFLSSAGDEASVEQRGERIEIVFGERNLFLDRVRGVTEHEPGVPQGVPEPVGDGGDVCSPIVHEHDVDVGARAQLGPTV